METVSKSRMNKFPLNLLQRLRLRKDGFSEFLDSLEEALIVFDEKLNFVRINISAKALFDLLGINVEGKNILDVLPDIKETGRYEKYLKVIRTGISYSASDIVPSPRLGNVHLKVKAFKVGNGLGMIVSNITGRKKLEQELKESEEEYRAIVETSLDGVYQVDSSGKFTFVNESFAKTFGYEQEELLGKHFSFLLGIETFPNVAGMVKEVLAGKSLRSEVPVLHKDGHEVMVNFGATPLKDGDEIVGLTGILRDITEQKRMKEELAKSEAKYRSLVETAGAGIAAINLKGELVLVNEALCRMMGYSKEELLGRNFAEFLHLDDKNEVLRIFAERLAGDEEHPYLEFRGVSKDGHPVWLYSSPTAVVLENELVGFSAIIHDITRRKQIEEAVKLGEQNYRLLFNSTVDAMFVIDAETMKLVLVNRAGREMAERYGFGALGDIASIDMLDYIHPDDRDRALRIIAEDMFEKNLRQINEFRVTARDGTEHWVSGVGTRTEYQGRVAGLLSVRDITERKRAQEREKELGRGLEFLARTSMSLLELPAGANIYRFIAERLQELAEGSVILVNSFDEDSDTFCMREAQGVGERMEALNRILGFNLIGMPAPISDEARQELSSGMLAKVSGGIYDLASGALPMSVCQEIEKLLDVGAVYSIGLTWEGRLYGSAVIIARNGTELNNWEVIETFVRQASIALQRRQAEEALKGSEEKYRALVEAAGRSGEGILIAQDIGDVEAALVFANDEFCKMVGYSREESLKMSAWDLISPDELVEVQDRYRRRQDGEEVSPHYTVNFLRKDGALIPTEVGVATMIYGGVAATVVFLRDITERKLAEDRLKESEQRFRLANQIANDVVYERDARTGVATFYGDIDEQMGYGLKEFPRTADGWIDCVHPEDTAKVMEQLGKQAGKGDTSILEYRLRGKDGAYRHWIDRFTNVWDDKREEVVKIIGVATDVTESKVAEAALRESEGRFRSVLDNSLDMVYRLNLQTGRYDYVSPSTERILGYSPEEFVAFTIEKGRSLAHPDDLQRLDENVIELITSKMGTASSIEYRIRHKELGYRWVSDNRSVVYDDAGNPVAVVGNLRDITERKDAEWQLWKTQERLQLMFDSVQDGICVANLGGLITDVNPKGLEMYRASDSREIIGKSALELIVREQREQAMVEMQRVLEQGTAGLIEHHVLRSDGSVFLAEMNVSLLRDISGKPSGFITMLRDISLHKHMEEALRRKEARFRAIFESSPLGIGIVNKNGWFIDINQHLQRFLGYSLEELRRMSFEEYMPLEDAKADTRLFLDMIKGKRDGYQIDKRYIRKDGQLVWGRLTVSVVRDSEPKFLFAIAMLEDITERKKAEEELRRSEEKFRAIFDNAIDGFVSVDPETRVFFNANKKMMEMLGYSSEEEMRNLTLSDIHPQQDLPWIVKDFERHVRRETSWSEYIPVKRKDGSIFYAFISSSPLTVGNRTYLSCIFKDVTERKVAEERLKESEERYRALVDTAGLAGEGIMIVERAEGNKAVIAFVNNMLSGMLGYQREEMLGMRARDLFLPGDRIWLQDKNRRRRKGEALSSHYSIMALRKGGLMLPIEMSMGAMTYHGKGATVVYVRDVTERKQAEEALRESEAQFRAIFDSAAIGVRLVDKDERTFKINPAFEHMLGYTLEELRRMPATDYTYPEDARIDKELFDEMVAGKRDYYQVDKRFIRKDGRIVWGRVTRSAVWGLEGKFQFAISMTEDVTEHKIALENLRKSEEHFRALTENALDSIVIINKDGGIAYGSPGYRPARGYKPEEVIGTNSFAEIHPEDMPKAISVYNELMQNPGATVSTQVRVRHKDGSWRIVEAIARNLIDNPAVAGIVINYHDITEREQAQDDLLRHMRHVEALHAIAQAASQTLEMEELLNMALDKVTEVMDADAGCIYLLDVVEKELVLKTHKGISNEVSSRVATIKLSEKNAQKMLQWKNGGPPFKQMLDEAGFITVEEMEELREKEQIKAFAITPFAVRGQLSGLIAVGSHSHKEFNSSDMDLLRAVGNQIGIGTQNATLYEEVKALIRQTIDAQERERERICLEVHDGVAQTLVSAFQYLQAMEATAPDDKQTKQLLAKTSAQVKQAIQESRDVINSLQPATLGDLGLVSTLRQELKRLGQETGLKIDFKADAIRLPKDVETGLYRIIHEAIFNARKHADTRQLRVKINSVDAGVRVEVRDWGKGFDQAYLARAGRRGTGLFSIRKRAELLKGTCEIQSKPGEGTMVCVEIPFDAVEKSSA